MIVFEQGISSGKQEHRAKKIPLQLKPGIGAGVENLSNHRVGRADDDDDQGQPGHSTTHSFVDQVNQTGNGQKRLHDSVIP